MKRIFNAKVRKISAKSYGITIPKSIIDSGALKDNDMVIITLEKDD